MIEQAFSATYREAREKFLAAANQRKLAVESHRHPLRGAEGEELATDMVLAGRADSASLLVLTSGTHGAEGFCGSGCQVSFLRDDILLKRLEERGVAVLLVHAVNPWGFSHLARTNEDNVDLNRNFVDFARKPAPTPVYDSLQPLLIPDVWPPTAENEAALQRAFAEGGAAARAGAVSGQGNHVAGLFYAGAKPTWSNGTVRGFLRKHAASRQRLGWIDLHTGLGPQGHGEKIFGATTSGPQATARALAWYGRDLMPAHSPQSVSPQTLGYIGLTGPQECPGVEYTFMTLEYGTLPFEAVMHALRGEAWLRRHPEAPARLAASIKRTVREAFYIDTDAWKGQILGQFRVIALQAIHGLAG